MSYFKKLDEIYLAKGYLVPKDLGLPLWLGKLLLWAGHRFGNFLRMSTVVDGTKVICFHDRGTLTGHRAHPNAHVETRYTLDLNFFRSKVFGEDNA